MSALAKYHDHRLPAPPRVSPGTAVRIRNLKRGFNGRTVVNDVTLHLAPGEFVALIGRSGSGKSTLLRALADLDDDVEGSGSIDVPENASVLFQDSRLLPWETVLRNITLGVRGDTPDERALTALKAVGLEGRGDDWPNTLSGGEQQRVALARSLLRDPALLLADEPFGALDALTRIRMHNLLFDLVRIHRPTVLLVTHDVEEALVLADRVLVMDEGRIALDRKIKLAHPRRRSDAEFEGLRATLLDALGVVDQL